MPHPFQLAPPNGAAYDNAAQLQRYAPKIYERAVATKSMPLGNVTGMTEGERDRTTNSRAGARDDGFLAFKQFAVFGFWQDRLRQFAVARQRSGGRIRRESSCFE